MTAQSTKSPDVRLIRDSIGVPRRSPLTGTAQCQFRSRPVQAARARVHSPRRAVSDLDTGGPLIDKSESSVCSPITNDAALWRRGGVRPPLEEVIRFIDVSRERVSAGLKWGVEPICEVLQLAPHTFYARTARPPAARMIRETELMPEINRVWRSNIHRVYVVDKVWARLNREGIRIARCTVGRLMRQNGMRGVTRGKTPRTTWPHRSASRPDDLVRRELTAATPNVLWVADLTYVKTFPSTRGFYTSGNRPRLDHPPPHTGWKGSLTGMRRMVTRSAW
jgi:hypothetical protein